MKVGATKTDFGGGFGRIVLLAENRARPPSFFTGGIVKPTIKHDDCTGVLIILPAYQQQNTSHTTSLLYATATMLTLSEIPHQLVWFSMSDIVEARNVFGTLFYDAFPQYSHLLMIDSDMHVDPVLIAQMIQFNKPLTGVFYSKREKLPEGGHPASLIIGHPLETEKIDIVDGFMPCRHVGGGILMVKREVIAGMIKQFPDLVDYDEVGSLEKCGISRVMRFFERTRDPVNKNVLSEDYAFCERWQQCGGEVWANVTHQINHVGPANYPMRYMDFLKAV